MITISQGLVQGQVLQRLGNGTATVKIQGTSSLDGSVEVRLLQDGRPVKQWERKVAGKTSRGRFDIALKGLPVGGPYQVSLAIGDETLVVDDVRVGDVWILAGQSNMEGYGFLAQSTPPDDGVRALYMDGHWGRAEDPLHTLNDSPDSAHMPIHWSPKVLARLSGQRAQGVGPGISFGAEMARRSGGVPQGLICCAHGGTSMEQWGPSKKSLGGASLYGSLLRVCKGTGQPVSGILWYQGESDTYAELAKLYYPRMVGLIRAFRKDLKQPKLAFLLAQLGNIYNIEKADEDWNHVQYDQTRLAREVDRVAYVATVDLSMMCDGIHLRSESQVRLGRRFAAEADRLVYGNRKELPPPEVESVHRLRKPASYNRGIYGLEVTFKNVVGGLCSQGPVTAFGLMDSAGHVTHPFCSAEIRGNKLRLETWRAISEPEDCFLVYGKGCNPTGLLADARDQAVAVFGPQPIFDPSALTLPFPRWRISQGQPRIASVAESKSAPQPKGLKLTACESPVFISPVPTPPATIQGVVFFFADIDVPEPMRGHFRFGYDGPFKLWFDDQPLFTDPDGVNPIIIDEIVRPVKLSKGRHRLTVAMDFSGGLAWGFLIRFARSGLTRQQLKSGKYRLPVCL